jgi:hypothetical protein
MDAVSRPGCRERNARGLEVVAVGVNKAADQYVVLNERTKQVMAGGRFKKEPGVPSSSRPLPARRRDRTAALTAPSQPTSRPRWSEAQENLAMIYRSMGMKPEEIARRLGVSPHRVTQILLAATS